MFYLFLFDWARGPNFGPTWPRNAARLPAQAARPTQAQVCCFTQRHLLPRPAALSPRSSFFPVWPARPAKPAPAPKPARAWPHPSRLPSFPRHRPLRACSLLCANLAKPHLPFLSSFPTCVGCQVICLDFSFTLRGPLLFAFFGFAFPSWRRACFALPAGCSTRPHQPLHARPRPLQQVTSSRHPPTWSPSVQSPTRISLSQGRPFVTRHPSTCYDQYLAINSQKKIGWRVRQSRLLFLQRRERKAEESKRKKENLRAEKREKKGKRKELKVVKCKDFWLSLIFFFFDILLNFLSCNILIFFCQWNLFKV